MVAEAPPLSAPGDDGEDDVDEDELMVDDEELMEDDDRRGN